MAWRQITAATRNKGAVYGRLTSGSGEEGLGAVTGQCRRWRGRAVPRGFVADDVQAPAR